MSLTLQEKVRVAQAPALFKTCTRCTTPKPVEQFHRQKRGAYGRASICKVCSTAKQAAWRAQNLDKHAVNSKAWRTRNPESARASVARCAEAHPEYEQGRARRRWADPAQRLVLQAARRNRRYKVKANGGAGLTAAELAETLAAGCAYCPAKATEIDHVLPIARGGKHERANVVGACRSCNARKSARTPEEWSASCR